MYKKITAIAAALLLITAGCGNVDDSSETDETETTSQTEEVTEDAVKTETVSATESPETTTAEPEVTTETTSAAVQEKDTSLAESVNVLSTMKTGMTEEEALSEFGIDNGFRYEGKYAGADYEYDYSMTTDNIFGTGLKGYMFAEFDTSDQKLICCGYHLGKEGNVESTDFPYSEAELSEAYNKIIQELTAEYGEGTRPEALSGEGVKDEMFWNDGSDQIWAIYGIDLWGADSGVNEIVVSRSIER